MKSLVGIVGLVVALVLATVVANSVPGESPSPRAAYTCSMHPSMKSDGPGKCPTCGMNLVMSQRMKAEAREARAQQMPVNPQMMMQSCMDMMKLMGMSDAMMMRCCQMMGARTNVSDPAALLALGEQLTLTDDQVRKLNRVTRRARRAANAILTDEQKGKLEELAKTPDTMMGMCSRMMPMMQGMMRGGGAGGPMVPGSMMQNIMGGMTMQAPDSARESEDTEGGRNADRVVGPTPSSDSTTRKSKPESPEAEPCGPG